MPRLAVICPILVSAWLLAATTALDTAVAQVGGPELRAQAALLIVNDPTSSGLDLPTLQWLLGNWRPAVDGLSKSDRYSFSYIPLTDAAEGSSMGRLFFYVNQGCEKVDSAQMLDLARKRLEEVAVEIHTRAQVEPLMRQINLAQDRAARAEDVAQNQMERLKDFGKLAHQLGVPSLDSPNTEMLPAVQRDVLTLGAELAGLKARRVAILEQIESRKAELATDKPEQKAVLDNLEKVVDIRAQQVQMARAMRQRAVVAQAEVLEAEVELSMAEAELAQRRAMLAAEGGSGQIERLNEQLADAQIEIAATAARLEVTQKKLAELAKLASGELVIDYQQARRAFESALSEREAATAELARLQRTRGALAPPKIIVISQSGQPSKP